MRQRRWLELLHEYDLQIKYQLSKDNVLAYALSRKSTLAAISSLQTTITNTICKASQQDPLFIKVTSTISIQSKPKKQKEIVEGFHLMEGLLCLNHRLYIPPHSQIKLQILSKAHDISIATHPGYIKNYNTLRKMIY